MRPLQRDCPAELDGRPLTWYGCFAAAGGLALDSAETATSYTDVPGMPGSHDLSLGDALGAALPGRRKGELAIGTAGTVAEVAESKRLIGALHGRRVALRWHPLGEGELRGRLSVGQWTDYGGTRGEVAATCTIEMDLDPYLYGAERAETATASSPEVYIRGNAPVWPVITVPGAAEAGDVAVYHGDGAVKLAQQVGDVAVTIDMAARSCRTAGGYMPVTLDSTYFPLEPGRQRVSSTRWPVTVTYTPLTYI